MSSANGQPRSNSRLRVWACALLLTWAAVHVIGVSYETHQSPFISTTIGDEPAPIYGSLVMLRDKNPFALRGQAAVYYGPILSVLALPAVVVDVGYRFATGAIHTLSEYGLSVIGDWGSLIFLARWWSSFAGVVLLVGVYRLFQTKTFNPLSRTWIPYLSAIFIGSDYLVFKHSHFFRHWIFLCAIFIWTMVHIVRLHETRGASRQAWLWLGAITVAGFGISYISVLYQIMLLPILVGWVQAKHVFAVKRFGGYVVSMLVACTALVWWNPTPFLRLVGMAGKPGYAIHLFGLPSLAFYLRVIAINHPLPIAFVIIMSALGLWRKQLLREMWWWMAVLGGMTHLLFFSSSESGVVRYALPTIIALYVLVVAFLARFESRRRIYWVIIFIACVIHIGAQLIFDLQWTRIAAQGPVEQRLVQALHVVPTSTQVLVVGPLLPAWHTPASYVNYETTCQSSSSRLLKQMEDMPTPVQVQPISPDYQCFNSQPSATELASHDTVIRIDGWPFDAVNYFDEAPWRWFAYDSVGTHFTLLKGTLPL